MVVAPEVDGFDALPPAEHVSTLPPHAPATGAGEAEQDAGAPPLLPVQVQFHGPEPLTVGEAAVVLHRLVVGALPTNEPFALPHAPFTDVAASEAEQLAGDPPF